MGNMSRAFELEDRELDPELRHTPKLERHLNQDGSFQSTHLSEVRGSCGRATEWLKKYSSIQFHMS
jgi:hypothetical protein